MAANSNLLISITAKDQASGTFRRIKVSLGELEKESSGAGESIGDLGKIFSSGLGKVAGGIAGFFAVGQLTQTTLELAKIGAQSERTRAAYDDLAAGAGASGQAMLAAMRTATAGTVADSEMMLAANRAMMLGVADNADEMSRLMAAAIERGRALGVSSSQAVNDIITGIGRMSPMILDNLGITGAAAAFDQYAVSLGKTADQLTDVEKKQALVNAVLASSSGLPVANDAAAAFERMDAALQNAKEALGVMFSPAIAAIADQIAAAATAAAEGATAQADASARTLELRTQLAGTRGEMMLAGIDDPSTQQTVLAQALAQTQQAQRQAAQEAVRLAENTQAEIAAIYASTPGISQADATQIYEGQLAAAQAATVELQAQAQQIVAVMGGWIGAKDTQAEYNRTLWEGVGAWTAFRTEAQIARDAVMASSQQIAAAAQGQIASIAQGIAAAQGDQAGLDWLEMMNRLLDDQIAKWAEEGRTVAQITGVLLPNFLDNLRKVADGANKTATATEKIGKGAQQASSAADIAWRKFIAGLKAVERRAAVTRNALARVADAVSAAQAAPYLLPGSRSYDDSRADELRAINDRLGDSFEDLYDTAYTGGGGGGIDGIGDAFDDLRGKIEGVIGEAMSADIGGLNPADFLPREDAINENARRLAAIMRDGLGNQEWMEEFKTEVPGIFEEIASSSDPRGAAARILQEFQQGLRPELLDREQIKARVRAMILGDQNAAALAQEIASELSTELGISLGQAQQAVAGAMGGIGTLGGGLDGEGVQAGPNGTVEGTAFVGAWVKVVTGMVDQFDASGKAAGTAFSAGFLSTQPALLDSWAGALVGKLIPAVVAALAAQGSRTGAQ